LALNMADEIRSKETEAKAAVADAKSEASQIIASARTAAEQAMKEAKQKSHRYFREQVKIAEGEADTEAVKTVEAGRREADAFYKSNRSKTEKVTDWLIKEVMSSYGNS